MVLALAAEVAARKPMQFRVDQRQEAIQRLVVPRAPTGWTPRDFAWPLHLYPQQNSRLLETYVTKTVLRRRVWIDAVDNGASSW